MEIVKAFQDGTNSCEINIRGLQNEPWFLCADVGRALNLSNINKNMDSLPDQDKQKLPAVTRGGIQNQWWVNEKGLYKLLFRSRVPLAQSFTDWVCDVLKDLRQTGQYVLQEDEQRYNAMCLQLQDAQREADKLKDRSDKLEAQLKRKRQKDDIFYVIDTHEGPNLFKLGKTGDKQARAATINTSHAYKPDWVWWILVDDAKLLEDLVFSALAKYRFDERAEFFSVELSIIVAVATRCAEQLKANAHFAEVTGGLKEAVEEPPKCDTLEEVLELRFERGQHKEGHRVDLSDQYTVNVPRFYEVYCSSIKASRRLSEKVVHNQLAKLGINKKPLARGCCFVNVRLKSTIPNKCELHQYVSQFLNSEYVENGPDFYTSQKDLFPAFVNYLSTEHKLLEGRQPDLFNKTNFNKAVMDEGYHTEERTRDKSWIGFKLRGETKMQLAVKAFLAAHLKEVDRKEHAFILRTTLWEAFKKCHTDAKGNYNKKLGGRDEFKAVMLGHLCYGNGGSRTKRWLDVVFI